MTGHASTSRVRRAFRYAPGAVAGLAAVVTWQIAGHDPNWLESLLLGLGAGIVVGVMRSGRDA